MNDRTESGGSAEEISRDGVSRRRVIQATGATLGAMALTPMLNGEAIAASTPVAESVLAAPAVAYDRHWTRRGTDTVSA